MADNIQRVVIWNCSDNSLPDALHGEVLVKEFSDMGYEVLHRSIIDSGGMGVSANSGDLHVISGGEGSVNGTDKRIETALAITGWLVEKAENNDIQLLGVGLGAQLIAENKAPGCVVASGKDVVGIKEIEWLQGNRDIYPVIHDEEIDAKAFDPIFKLTRAWDKNEEGKVAVYAFDDRVNNVYGTLFHPEFTVDQFRRLTKGVSEDNPDVSFSFNPVADELYGVLKRREYSQPDVFRTALMRLGVRL